MRIRTLLTAGALALASLVVTPTAHAAYCDKTFIGPDDARIMTIYVCYDDTLDNYNVQVSSNVEALVIAGASLNKTTVDGPWVTYTVCVDYYYKGDRYRVCQVLPIS